ncbi:hypothetical protein C0Q70_02191 [Pomacea canaliculata]|uniref:DNA topoisomerase n=1 Tax=Pomacea canaliculata TaxID=400727 RepID=A0A2T7Q1M6_POMCA|nr:hypothetical protein C0Q70_02191 [Pomacea canaliculata]
MKRIFNIFFRRNAVRSVSTTIEMVRILNVAEKNDAAKSIADVMSRGHYRKREGFSKFNKIYEFESSILDHQNCTMTFTSVSGHLLALEFPIQYRKWMSCSPVELFNVPVEKYCPKDYEDIKRTLENEIRGCQKLVIWTDCDREGENIGFEVIQVCRAVKPNIQVYRARFSEITPHAIANAARNLVRPDQLVSDAVDVRIELDLRIGAAFTRFQTLRLKKVFPEALAEQLISYGSCQFPTLGFVVERYKQVQAFVPEPFWKLKVTHLCDDVKAEFVWKRNRLFNHLACFVLYHHCIENPVATVVDVNSKSKNKWRPVALDTVEMEKLVSRKLHINAKETMRVAEKLYTQGFISYPRTETNIFPKDLDLVPLVTEQARDPNWGEFAQQVLQQGPHPRNGNKTDNAHPPIHPLKYTNQLQGNEQRIYEFIVRHFLACCSQDAQGHETVVEIDVAAERMVAGETSPPSLLTEADLIALMEKHGIGTDATHAEHIETIKSRMYVGLRPDGRFVPGHLGMGLVEGYDQMGYEMSKPHLRAELEADLKAISEGRKQKNDVLVQQVQKYKDVFIEACRQALKLDEALSQYLGQAQTYTPHPAPTASVVKPCPHCGHNLTLRTKKNGKGYYIGCSNYPECRHALWLPDFVLEADVDSEICPTCQPGPVHLLRFRFRPGSVPPTIPNNFTGCVGGCDEMLSETLGITRSLGTYNRVAGNTNNSVHRGTGCGTGTPNARSLSTIPNPTVFATSQTPPADRNNQRARGNPAGRIPLGLMDANAQNRERGQQGSAARSTMAPDSTIVCSCGHNARLFTVRKEGPNTGRQFYGCGMPQKVCTFFLWADEQETGRQGHAGSNIAQLNNVPPTSMQAGEEVQCNCGLAARRLTVQKDGPNKGKEFYGCSKPRAEGCGFFQWACNVQDNRFTGSSSFPGQGRGPGTGGLTGQKRKLSSTSEATPAARRPRRCGLCGVEGSRCRSFKADMTMLSHV